MVRKKPLARKKKRAPGKRGKAFYFGKHRMIPVDMRLVYAAYE